MNKRIVDKIAIEYKSMAILSDTVSVSFLGNYLSLK